MASENLLFSDALNLSTKNQFVSGISWNTLTVVFQIIIQLIYTGLLARMISESSFALMGIVLAIMGFAEIFSQVGIGPALIQRKEVSQGHINAAFFSSILLGSTFTLAFIALAPWIASIYKIPELIPIIRVVASSFVISALAVVPRSIMIKEMRFRRFFVAGMISIIGGNLVVGLTLAYFGYDVWSYVWALFAQNLLMTLGFWSLQKVKITFSWSWNNTRELIRYGGGSTLFNALNYAATKMDVTLVPLFCQKIPGMVQEEQMRVASMYERSSYIMQQPITVMGKLSDNVLFSGMSKLQDEREKLERTILFATNTIACAIVPATVFIDVFAPDIIRIYLGEKFNDAVPVLQVLFLAVIFRSLSKLSDSLLRARDAVYIGSVVKLIYVLLIALGIYVSVPFGMPYVAGAIVLATMIHYIMSLYLCNRLIQVSYFSMLKALLPSVVLGIIVLILSLGAFYFSRWIEVGALISLFLGLILNLSVVLILIYRYPKLLGPIKWNPLSILPDRISKIGLLSGMISRLK